MMRWIQYRLEEPPAKEVVEWVTENRFHPRIIPILTRRGITSAEQCKKLFFGTIEDTFPSTAFGPEMIKAVKRLKIAFENKENIVIFGDYDVDGTTGTAIMMGVLSELQKYYHFHVDFMIPDRFNEGYGLNDKNIQRLIHMNPSLVVTVDCGISSGKQITALKERGIDVIVTDHHEPKAEIPYDAIAIIHPKFCNYPFDGLSGAGVAYQTMKALWEVNGKKAPPWVIYDQLDLVALGAVCDLMKLQDDNRIYVKYGMKLIQQGRRLAFHIMGSPERLRFFKKVDTNTLGFKIGPRINAAGRMEEADCVVELLLSNNVIECNRILDILEKRNQERQAAQEYVLKNGMPQLDSIYKNINVVIGDHTYHEGVLGICASKFMEKRYKPTFVLALNEEGMLKGSARSIEGINLFHYLHQHEKYLYAWGGHHAAAGLTIATENAATFFKKLDESLDHVPKAVWTKTRYWEGDLTLDDIDESFFQSVLALEPTGVGFPSVAWRITGEVISGKILGDDKRIGKLLLKNKQGMKRIFPFVMWEKASNIHFEQEHTLYGFWEWNEFNNGMQFRAVDVDGNLVKELSLGLEQMLELG
jgi:single-stranded-DNA-specific exonuclease